MTTTPQPPAAPGEDPGVPPDDDPAEQPDPESNSVAAFAPDDPEDL